MRNTCETDGRWDERTGLKRTDEGSWTAGPKAGGQEVERFERGERPRGLNEKKPQKPILVASGRCLQPAFLVMKSD